MKFGVYFFAANDRVPFGQRYDFILDVARTIDQYGFTAIWTPERHFAEFGGSFPNPSVLSAALATVTNRIELRAGSVVLPHHHPVRIAEEWALVDQLSKGRVALCCATGWHKGDFVFYPENYANRRTLTFDNIKVLRDLWAGRPVAFPGVDGQPVQVVTYPRPFRSVLPIWLVHSSSTETWVKAGELGANVLTLLDSFDRIKTKIQLYRESLARHGHDPDAGIVTVGLHTYVADDEDAVRRLVSTPVKEYLRTFLAQRRSDAAAGGGSRDPKPDEIEMIAAETFEDMYSSRSLLGTVPKCAEVVEAVRAIGADEIACLIDFGLPFTRVLGGLSRLNELRRMFAAVDPNPATWYFNRQEIS